MLAIGAVGIALAFAMLATAALLVARRSAPGPDAT
jgi:hypothetical protein